MKEHTFVIVTFCYWFRLYWSDDIIGVMNKDAIIRKVASKLDLQYKVVKDVTEMVFDTISDCLNGEEPVNIVGFGTFDLKTRSSRQGRNPKTGETMVLPKSTRAYFKPGRSLKRLVKKKPR